MKKFLVTTPIYYPNGYPHIWHAYASFIADFFARYKRLLGYEVKFSTGNDENSQKIVQAAEKEGQDIMTYLDVMWAKREQVWTDAKISYTDFIRTTHPEHKKLVQKMLQTSFDTWDIYEWEYRWYYCVGCEGFKTEKDLISKDGQLVCPDHLTKPDLITEKNRFFRLKEYENKLKEIYIKNPQFIVPDYRFNEVKSFVNGWLEDFSVSRESNTFGIPLPFDDKQVTYVRYDALFNYVTACQKDTFWTEDTEIIHILGKDISRFHAIFRPAMLMSVQLPLPDKEFITGYFTVNGQKMSKSLGNVIDPIEMIQNYDRDAVIFNLLYDIPIGADGDFSEERLRNVYESMLIGWRGNLVNRVTSLCKKYEITEGKNNQNLLNKLVYNEEWNESPEALLWLLNVHDVEIGTYIENHYLKHWLLQKYLQDRYKLVQKSNEFITKAEPWVKRKNPDTKQDAENDLKFLLYIIKNLALLSAPILINGFAKIQDMFGNDELNKIDSWKNTMNDDFKTVFDMENFTVNLNPQIIYQRKEA